MSKDGMNYAPEGKTKAVCEYGEFVFSVIGLDHGHIYGMTNGLLEAGGKIKYVYDPDPRKVEAFVKRYPNATAVSSEGYVLDDKETLMVAGACVTSERCALGMRVMSAEALFYR